MSCIDSSAIPSSPSQLEWEQRIGQVSHFAFAPLLALSLQLHSGSRVPWVARYSTPVPAPAPTSCSAFLPGSALSRHPGFLKGQKCETRGCPDLAWKIRECQIRISKKYALKPWSICFVPITLLGTGHSRVVSQIDTAEILNDTFN